MPSLSKHAGRAAPRATAPFCHSRAAPRNIRIARRRRACSHLLIGATSSRPGAPLYRIPPLSLPGLTRQSSS